MQSETWNGEYRDPRELRAHPDNPRDDIDPESPEMIELSNDIKSRGLLQPVVITPDGRILIGHRRTKASIRAGLERIPVIIRHLSATEFAEDVFLAENMQRQDLSPLEEARALSRLKAKLEKQLKKAIPNTDLARRTSLPPYTVSVRLAILELPERIQKLFHLCEVPANSSKELLRLKEWPDQLEGIADRLANRQITGKSLNVVVTRLVEDLRQKSDAQAVIDRQPRLKRIHENNPQGHHTPVVTRKSVLENLEGNTRRSITLFNVKQVMETTCCNCGLSASETVCLSCPLPKFVNGLIGRADD